MPKINEKNALEIISDNIPIRPVYNVALSVDIDTLPHKASLAMKEKTACTKPTCTSQSFPTLLRRLGRTSWP
jgi:hypothetical protein